MGKSETGAMDDIDDRLKILGRSAASLHRDIETLEWIRDNASNRDRLRAAERLTEMAFKQIEYVKPTLQKHEHTFPQRRIDPSKLKMDTKKLIREVIQKTKANIDAATGINRS
jgi:hypothetical protein